MDALHPQFIKDTNGNNSLVVLNIDEFTILMEKLDELDDIRLYDQSKKEDKGERILFTDYLKNRKSNA
ncbi:MAG: hypothetical protein LBV46_03285 [Bacteroidales bacterium]|jgi:hypothetical protein|nr:hypothetical protein [Bacteroidales bacterium]